MKKATRVFVCDCEGSLPLRPETLAAVLEAAIEPPSTRLCRAQLARFEAALTGEAPILVACTQEAPLFLETAGAEAAPEVRFQNIREKAGWSREGAKAAPKMAALLAEAMLDVAGAPTVTMTSGGEVLVLGRDEVALEAAGRLVERLSVNVVLTGDGEVVPPRLGEVAIFRGGQITARGHLGAFELEIEAYAPALPSSRARLAFETVAGRGQATSDLILDLRGGTPLFPAPEKRDGYFNPDPGDPAAVARALYDIVGLVGEFEKPRYVAYRADICVHGRSGIVGCSLCVDNCPTGAVVSAGEAIEIDAFVCAGCGTCAALCPTGAAGYALPTSEVTLRRMKTMLESYGKAGGEAAVLLVHDGDDGEAMLDALGRHFDGLPANVLPFAVNAVTQLGLEALTAALAYGARSVLVLVPPRLAAEADGLRRTTALADHIARGLGYGPDLFRLVEEADPEAVSETLWACDFGAERGVEAATFLPLGDKRTLLGLALTALHAAAPEPVDELALPEGAPFGAIEVEVGGCTLCLACVGACPVNALRDDPDHPRLSFVEAACVQCGLCRRTCPEKVIQLRPRLDFTGRARVPRVLKEERPFDCVRCGKPFGVRSTIEGMLERLAAHAMYQEEGALDRLRMCADCRVIDLSEAETHPFAAGARPVPRTTDDYLAARERGEDDDGEDE